MTYSIGIYKDKKGTILVIPYGHDENGAGRNLSKYAIIRPPYGASAIGKIVKDCFKECVKEPFIHSKNAEKVFTLATGIDNWADFSRGKLYVSGNMCSENGFTFSQWKRYYGGAFGSDKGLKQFYFKTGLGAKDETIGEIVLKAFDSPPVPRKNDEDYPINELNEKISEPDLTRFLLNLSKIFLLVRADIYRPYNSSLLILIRNYMYRVNNDFSLFHRELADSLKMYKYLELMSLEEFNTFLYAIKTNGSERTLDNIDEVTNYFPVIKACINEICLNLSEKNYDRAYDLVDAIHCLPEAILYKREWNPKAYWKNYIKPYRYKWDKDFLLELEQKVVRRGFLEKILRL